MRSLQRSKKKPLCTEMHRYSSKGHRQNKEGTHDNGNLEHHTEQLSLTHMHSMKYQNKKEQQGNDDRSDWSTL